MDPLRRLVSLINYIFLGIVSTMPWLLRVAWHILSRTGGAFRHLLMGVPDSVDRLAYGWQLHAADAGLDIRYERWVYVGVCLVAVTLVSLGWIGLALITAELIYHFV